MYHVYVKEDSLFDSKKLIGEYSSLEKAEERAEKEVQKNPETLYVIEETTGHVDNYGELISNIVKEN